MAETIGQLALRIADGMPECCNDQSGFGRIYEFEPQELEAFAQAFRAELDKPAQAYAAQFVDEKNKEPASRPAAKRYRRWITLLEDVLKHGCLPKYLQHQTRAVIEQIEGSIKYGGCKCKKALSTPTNLEAAPAAPAQDQEPFGYFRATPFGWEDCEETDEGAVALYERPAVVVPEGWKLAPIKPIQEQLDAAMRKCGIRGEKIYSVMLDVAPNPPSAPAQGQEADPAVPADAVAKDAEIEYIRAQLATAKVQYEDAVAAMQTLGDDALRTQLAEVTRERDGLRTDSYQYGVRVGTEYCDGLRQQILAAQAHAARLEYSLGQWQEGSLNEPHLSLCYRLTDDALSTAINLDALYEHEVQECERLALDVERNWINISRWLRQEADAHRAKKDAAMAASTEGGAV